MEGGEVEKIGEDKRKREDSLEKEPRKKKKIGANAIELDEEPRAGPSSAVTPRPSPRLSISGFRFHQVLGTGGFGKVVLASVRRTNIFKAIKIVNKYGNRDDLQSERRLLLVARDCPFLCHLSGTLQSQEHAYFIMEHLSGGSLRALIAVSGHLNRPTIRFFTAELICGLQFLHSRGIVHRDIKPGNIMLDGDGHIRIIDLGLAQDGLTASSKILGRAGTFNYMAPEMLLRQAYTVAVDWWSLGIVISKMATGHSPFFDGPQRLFVQQSITTDKPSFPPWLKADLKHLIKNLLRKDPERRLGVTGNIRSHPFFGDLRWAELEQRRIEPPFKPFPHVVGTDQLYWPEDIPALHPLSDFTYLAPSWTQ